MVNNAEARAHLLGVSKRNVTAFVSLYEQTAPLLLRVARQIVCRQELAEEIVQETYLKLWRSTATFDTEAANPIGWLTTIVRNRAIDVVTSSYAQNTECLEPDLEFLSFPEAFPDVAIDELAQRRSARTVRCWLSDLRSPERQAIALAYFHDMSHAEVAKHLGQPLGSVKSLIRRGLGHMRKLADVQEPFTG